MGPVNPDVQILNTKKVTSFYIDTMKPVVFAKIVIILGLLTSIKYESN